MSEKENYYKQLLDEQFNERINEQNRRIKELERKVENLSETKTPTKLFYLFVSAFSLFYVIGIVRIYQKTTENTIIFEKGIAGVRVTQTELKEKIAYTTVKSEQVENAVYRMQDKIEEAIREIRKQIRED